MTSHFLLLYDTAANLGVIDDIFIYLFDCVGVLWPSQQQSCRAGQLIVALFLGRLTPSKRLTSTKRAKRGRPRQ